MASVCLSPNGLEKWSAARAPRALLIATADGIVRLEQRAAAGTWRVAGAALRGLHIGSLLREPRNGLLFAGVHGTGLYRSSDEGRSWSAATAGLRHTHIFCLASVEEPDGVALYAGTEPAHLYRSRDLGESWQELPALRAAGCDGWSFPAPPHLPHVKHIAFDPCNSRRIFVCIEQGALLRSEDGGETFHALRFQDHTFRLNNDAHRVVFNPHEPAELCLVGGEGISRSRDGGETWERLTTPAMRVSYPDAFCYSPEEPGVLFVAGSGSTPDLWLSTGEAAGALACSRDDGRSWSAVRGGLPRRLAGNIEALSLVVWPGSFGFFAGTTDGDIFHSEDRGRHWARIAAGLPPVSKCVHHHNVAAGRARQLQVRMAALQAMRF